MEEQLVVSALKGNRESLAKLLYENYEIVFKYFIKFTLNKGTAEELVQETMVRAIEKFSMYDPAKSKFSTWLIAIGQNIYIDNLRKRKREQKYINEELPLFDPGDRYGEYDDSLEHALEALSHLDEGIRAPIILKHYYGYSLEEIAAIMSIPLGTVKSRIHNGLKTIRKELE
jgi:RNA polymerase sigma-70 factor (ECF subfamily)